MTTKPLIKQNHVKYLQGTLPIIISSSHGGDYEPENIPDRTSGVFDTDDYTQELTLDIIEEFFAQTRQYPHAVIMNLARTKVDANRPFEEAVSDNKDSMLSYKSFHDFIEDSKQNVEKKYNRGLYIDIHGQSHTHKAIEFGYLLTNHILRLDNKLDEFEGFTSIKAQMDFSPFSFSEQIRGNFSLGNLMNKRGYDSIPSCTKPYANDDNEYFEGAYNTKTHGSLIDGNISAIQVEFPYYCRESKENRKATAKALVTSLIEYMLIHYGLDLKS